MEPDEIKYLFKGVIKMKKLFKKLALFALIIAVLLSAVSFMLAATTMQCKITVNGENKNWKPEPFLAYGPQDNVLIMIPIENLFTALGYKAAYNPKLSRTVYTAPEDSDYISFYIDLKTGQIIKEGEKAKESSVNQINLVNNITFINISNLEQMAKIFLNDPVIKIDYNYVHTEKENYIIKYSDFFTIQNNLSSFKIDISENLPIHPFTGDQYTKYNTGDWVLGSEVKRNFKEISLKSLWEGFDDLHFYTGKGEQNELTSKGTWNSKMYSIAWEMMDAVADEINRLRKQDGLPELSVDNSLCFISVGAKDPKVDSVFDNAIHNIETNKATHTYNVKSKMAECIASGIASYNEKDRTTLTIARQTVNQWYKSTKGHKEIIMNKKYKTMGILVIITDTRAMDTYAVFK
jgi:hypothetical protein